MVDGVELPLWRWDDKAGVLVPSCPKCGGTVSTSGSKLSCLLMGYSHYSARLSDVVETSLGRLAGS